jgi:small GTP-binding protein
MKVVLLGNNFVGKTSLIWRSRHGTFLGDQSPIIPPSIVLREVMVKGEPKQIRIFDRAHSERPNCIGRAYAQGATGIVIVFDVARWHGLSEVPGWVKCLSECEPGIPVIIVGNKCDREERHIFFEEGEAYARGLGYAYFETSAKTGAGVEEAFGFLAEQMSAPAAAPVNLVTGKGRDSCWGSGRPRRLT